MNDQREIPPTLVEQLWKKYLQQTPPPFLHSSLDRLTSPQLPQGHPVRGKTSVVRDQQ